METSDRVGEGERLIDAVESALASDAAVVLLTPAAVASRASGAEWEALLGPASDNAEQPLLAVTIEPCVPPAMLRRRAPRDATEDAVAAWRSVKQWLLRTFHPAEEPVGAGGDASDADIEALRESASDRAGVEIAPSAAVLREFARRCWRDFERAIVLDCHWRNHASLVGELGARLGVAMEGPEDADAARLADALREPRLLLALDGLESPASIPLGPLCSLVVAEPDPPDPPTTAVVLAALRRWHANPSDALAMVPAAIELYARAPWDEAREFGRLAFLLLHRERRYTEAFDWASRLSRRALKEADKPAFEEAEREKAWILARWEGGTVESPTSEPVGEQLSLFD